MSQQTITVPDIGGAEGVEVIEVCVAVGDRVELEQSLIVLESDKASMEVPADVAGIVVELLVKEGDELSEGSPVLVLGADASEDAAPASEPEPLTDAPEPAAPVTPAAVAQPSATSASGPESTSTARADASAGAPRVGGDVYAGPAVRKLAREFGVELERVAGSGPRRRILKQDLQDFVKKSLGGATNGAGIPPIPEVDFSAFGETDTQPLSKIDKVTAENMHRSWLNVPRVTQFDEADITELEAFRKTMKAEAEQRGIKLTPLPFVLKACAAALRDNPRLNASLSGDGESLVYKKYVHIGMAVDTPAGLMVPVIRDVDQKSLWQLAGEAAELALKARDRKLRPTDMQGASFTISSLGSIGGAGFTPIINAPEVAILGISKLSMKPIWNGAEFEPRKMLPLALAYDHRVVNGGDGGRFMAQLTAALADIRRLLL